MRRQVRRLIRGGTAVGGWIAARRRRRGRRRGTSGDGACHSHHRAHADHAAAEPRGTHDADRDAAGRPVARVPDDGPGPRHRPLPSAGARRGAARARLPAAGAVGRQPGPDDPPGGDPDPADVGNRNALHAAGDLLEPAALSAERGRGPARRGAQPAHGPAGVGGADGRRRRERGDERPRILARQRAGPLLAAQLRVARRAPPPRGSDGREPLPAARERARDDARRAAGARAGTGDPGALAALACRASSHSCTSTPSVCTCTRSRPATARAP